MKGTVFLKPLEFNLEATGEKWCQGDKIIGTVKVKNHSSDSIVVPVLKVMLAEGNYKKIKAKDAKAFKSLATLELAKNLSATADEAVFPFEFQLAENSLITDKNGSLYLAFFDKEDTQPSGHIELAIAPRPVITQVLEVIENFIRFKVKEIKYVKNMVEVKLIPPSSREMSTVEGLILSMSEVDKNLTLHYNFSLRGLDLSSATTEVQKKTKEVTVVCNSKQYLIYGQSLNQDFIIESVNKVLAEVKPKFI